MKVSIITPTLNCDSTLPITLASIASQNYSKIEHIIIDGGSSDKTLEIIKEYNFKNKKCFFFKKKKLYESINYGIKKSSGDLIAILNSDDFYNNDKIIKKIVQVAKKKEFGIFIGHSVYFNYRNFENIIRNYNCDFFSPNKLRLGLMPAHTASFIKKEVYNDVGYYDENMKIAADFDFFLRSILINKKKYYKLNMIVTRMKTGGVSNKGLISYVNSTIEILESFKKNKIKTNILNILARIPMKLEQFFSIDNAKLNKHFSLPNIEKYRKYFYDFKILQKAKNLDFKKNFILSAMNLSFLGSYYTNIIKFNADFIHWPDGIYSKTLKLNKKISKIPGRLLLSRIKIPKYIKNIIVLGNLSLNSKKFLEAMYNRKVYNHNLSYGTAEEIYDKTKYKKIKETDLVFLTLPTPKQEILAGLLAEDNKFYKIICIGGSVAIAAHEEKPVPKYLYEYEWVWRLRYETYRRVIRLLKTFFSYHLLKLLTNKFTNITAKIID